MQQIRILLCLFASLVVVLPAVNQARASNAYARNFEFTDYPGYRILEVRNRSQDSTRAYRYALIPRGETIPELEETIQIIRTPVRGLVAMETVYIGYLDALEQIDALVGAATVNFISHPEVRRRAEDGRIKTVQFGQALDVESLLLLQPDLILTSISGDPTFDAPPRLKRSGLPTLITAGYMEQHPLARAEWIKVMAALFDLPERGESIFREIEEKYEALVELTKDVEKRPSVFSGAPYSGAWYVAGGESYTARAIRDAGGHYLWADNKSAGAIPLDTERVFQKAADADFWINPSHFRSLPELLAADARFAKFAPVANGTVFNNTRQVGPHGGNNIWERGVVRPDEVLADLIHIFHPELLPDHRFNFYESL